MNHEMTATRAFYLYEDYAGSLNNHPFCPSDPDTMVHTHLISLPLACRLQSGASASGAHACC